MAEPVNSLLEDMPKEEDMRKLIECPVCMEIPLPPIYLCTKGHIVCNSCQHRTYACPLCKERYCSTRSFVAEGIVENLILRCRYADDGCPLTMKGSEIPNHTLMCDYRPVKCHECGGKPINYSEYEDHLFQLHRIIGIEDTESCVAYRMNLSSRTRNFADRCLWPQYYMKAYDKLFLLRLDATNTFLCAWVCLFGPKADCDNYAVYIEFQKSYDDEINISWTGPVNHFREDPRKSILLQGKGLPIPVETIMEVAAVSTERAEWIYRVVIVEKPILPESITTPPEDARAVTSPTTPISRSCTGESVSRAVTSLTSESTKETESGGQTTENENPHSPIPSLRLYSTLHEAMGINRRTETASFEGRIQSSVLESCRTASEDEFDYSDD